MRGIQTVYTKLPRHGSLFLETEHVEGDRSAQPEHSALRPRSAAKRCCCGKVRRWGWSRPGCQSQPCPSEQLLILDKSLNHLVVLVSS